MYCRDCQYPLHSIESCTCPECGRYFDPDNTLTFLRRPGFDWQSDTAKSLKCFAAALITGVTVCLLPFTLAFVTLGVSYGLAGFQSTTSSYRSVSLIVLVLNSLLLGLFLIVGGALCYNAIFD